ncbi:alpha/beta hydrolase [Streptomyces sp. NBC_00841]|uniref:alpha/beta hydrolase n=1 Tax=unclassified Streptomyces TaxID=2593676 RepID=UPI00224CF00D|nr:MULTISPECIES: alpha/beta hydrolase [unclassified Streptomyces]MCX4536761.1 alpha/beta hydrolase [Streptomyces sp. NBC_01669]WRZ97974.1 alpha/beta hydrolase [Streptomyces sp. NBC_00841]
MTVEKVEFSSDGYRLVGDLHLPEPGTERGAVVLTGPFSGVKEQVTGCYAKRFAQRGYLALAFDHRNWGDSEGEPRQHEDASAKVSDLRNAVSFLAARPEVDPEKIAVCGVCLGGIYSVQLAAFDPRVKAVALIAAAYNNPGLIRDRFGAENFAALMGQFAQIAQRQFETGEIEYWPAVNPEGMPAGNPGPEPFEYYGTVRGAGSGWENRCTALSVLQELTLDVDAFLPLVTAPLLIVHGSGDQAIPVADAEAAFAAAPEPKELLLLDTSNHIELYDDDNYVLPAIDRTVSFFDRNM